MYDIWNLGRWPLLLCKFVCTTAQWIWPACFDQTALPSSTEIFLPGSFLSKQLDAAEVALTAAEAEKERLRASLQAEQDSRLAGEDQRLRAAEEEANKLNSALKRQKKQAEVWPAEHCSVFLAASSALTAALVWQGLSNVLGIFCYSELFLYTFCTLGDKVHSLLAFRIAW